MGPLLKKWATGAHSVKVTIFKLSLMINCLKSNNVCKFLSFDANSSKNIEWARFYEMGLWALF